LLQTFQLIQLILFFIPVFVLFGLGSLILIKSVLVIHRRWYLGVALPLLLATPFAILEYNQQSPNTLIGDWRFWLILGADLLLIILVFRLYRGWVVFGLNSDEIQTMMVGYFESQAMGVDLSSGQRHSRLGRVWEARVIQVAGFGQNAKIWILERSNEVILQADSATGACLIKKILPDLRKIEKPYIFNRHTLGILYIVLGVVLAVFGWIFFFEPRLILLE